MLRYILKYEGTLRNADINNQGICAVAMYALLVEDYYMHSGAPNIGVNYMSEKILR